MPARNGVRIWRFGLVIGMFHPQSMFVSARGHWSLIFAPSVWAPAIFLRRRCMHPAPCMPLMSFVQQGEGTCAPGRERQGKGGRGVASDVGRLVFVVGRLVVWDSCGSGLVEELAGLFCRALVCLFLFSLRGGDPVAAVGALGETRSSPRYYSGWVVACEPRHPPLSLFCVFSWIPEPQLLGERVGGFRDVVCVSLDGPHNNSKRFCVADGLRTLNETEQQGNEFPSASPSFFLGRKARNGEERRREERSIVENVRYRQKPFGACFAG